MLEACETRWSAEPTGRETAASSPKPYESGVCRRLPDGGGGGSVSGAPPASTPRLAATAEVKSETEVSAPVSPCVSE